MMNSKRILLKELLESPVSEPLPQAVLATVRQEALIVYPTETIYGIGGRVCDMVLYKLFEAKRRPADNQFILLAGSLDAIAEYAIQWNDKAKALMHAFWPGNVTLIAFSETMDVKLAVRLSPHPFMQWIDRELGIPLFSSSANISGMPYHNDPDRIFSTFQNDIGVMIDDGVLPVSSPSTVVDVSQPDIVRIVRVGIIPAEDIHAAVSDEWERKKA